MPVSMGGAFQQVGVRAVVEGFNPYMRNLGKMETKTKGFGGTLGNLGKTAAAMGAGFIAAQASMVGVSAVFSKSIGAAMKFEAQLAEIRALTGATAKDTKFLEGAIKDMAKTLPKSPAELGAGAYFILSSGIEDAADAVEVLEIAAKASTIGLGETSVVANALTTVLNAYGKEAGEAGQVTDVLIQAVKDGKAEADAFAGVLGRVVPLAAQMGISFEEVAANLATFTRLGVSADEAATGLRQVMASLLKPTEDTEEAMAELGFSAQELRQQVKDKGLLVVLDELMKRTGGNEEAIARLFPNIRALTSVLGTAGVQMEDYTNILANAEGASGNLEEGLAIVSDTAQYKTQMAMQELNLALMELGETSLPLVTEGATGLSTTIRLLTGDMRTWKDAAVDVAEGLKDVVIWNLKGGIAVEALAGGIEDAGVALGIFNKETGEAAAITPQAERAWLAFDKEMAEAAMLQAELEGALGNTGTKTAYLSGAVDALTNSLKGATAAQSEFMETLGAITSQRTQETLALDIQINALEKEENAALQAEVGQTSLGGATASTTDAIDRQIGALRNLAASMVPQALNDEIIALDRELTVLELGRAEIEAQINARNRLANAMLAMTHVANLPDLAKQKQLELDRAKILQRVGGDTEKLTDKQQDQIDVIDEQIEALQTDIDVRTLEAEVTNLQAEASDENREAMESELNEIIEQIGSTEDLKNQRELYIDTLVPVELLQEIDALGNQKTALDNAATGISTVTGETQTLSDAIGDQITDLELQKTAIDLVTEGWRLQGEAIEDLPSLEDIGKRLEQLRALLIIEASQDLLGAIVSLNAPLAASIAQYIGQLTAWTPAQHGFYGTVTGPRAFYIEPGQTEHVAITPQSQPVLAPSVSPQVTGASGGTADPTALAGAVALALQGLTVEMDGRVVGNIISDRLGDQTSLLGRGG